MTTAAQPPRDPGPAQARPAHGSGLPPDARNQRRSQKAGQQGSGSQGCGHQQGQDGQQGDQGVAGRGFVGMDDDQQPENARQGGEARARSQDRDDQCQSAASMSGSIAGRSPGGSGGSRSWPHTSTTALAIHSP